MVILFLAKFHPALYVNPKLKKREPEQANETCDYQFTKTLDENRLPTQVSQGKDVILYFARNLKKAETLAYNSSSDANPWPQAWLNP